MIRCELWWYATSHEQQQSRQSGHQKLWQQNNLSGKPRREIITAAASTSTSTSNLSSTKEIRTAFNNVLSQELKLHNYFLCHWKCSSLSSSIKNAFNHSWLADEVFDTMQGQVSGGFATRRNQVCPDYYVASTILDTTPETNLKFGKLSPPWDCVRWQLRMTQRLSNKKNAVTAKLLQRI